MSITRSPLKFPAGYKLCNSPLESISCHKYLGVFIQDNLEWDSHVKSVKHKAMKILGLLRRNFSGSSQYVKTKAYNSLVRPHVEYASAAWSPFEKQHIKALEAVQRCSIRFVCSDYSQFSSFSFQFQFFSFYYVFCIKYHKTMQCSQLAIASRGEHCLQ